MKLYIYDYLDNYGKAHYQSLEITDEDANEWITIDYERRLANAKPGEVVEKRTAQQIQDEMDKEFYNSDRREWRHKAHYTSCKDDEGNELNYIDTVADETPTPEEQLIQEEERKAALAKLDILSETQRKRYLMRYKDEMTLKEIAKIEGKDISSIKESLDSAIKKLHNPQK